MLRFKEQTDRDLREALISYAAMQIGMCKKVAAAAAHNGAESSV